MMMLSSTLTLKGQTTILAEIRRKLTLKLGDRTLCLEEEGRVQIIVADKRVRDLQGLLPKPDQPVSLEEMDEAIGMVRKT